MMFYCLRAVFRCTAYYSVIICLYTVNAVMTIQIGNGGFLSTVQTRGCTADGITSFGGYSVFNAAVACACFVDSAVNSIALHKIRVGYCKFIFQLIELLNVLCAACGSSY